MSSVQIVYTKIQVQASITARSDATTPEFTRERVSGIYMEKFVHVNAKGKDSLGVKTLKGKRSY